MSLLNSLKRKLGIKSLNDVLSDLGHKRSSLSKEDFLSLLNLTKDEKIIVGVFYDKLLQHLSIYSDSFSPYPEDDIVDLYRVDPDDMEDMFEEIFNQFEVPTPNRQAQIDYNNDKNRMDNTMESSIRFLCYFIKA